MKLTAPNYGHTVTFDGACIWLHAPDGTLIGVLHDYTPPRLGDEVDAAWDAAQWLLMAPQDGHGADANYWDEHLPEHWAWLKDCAQREDILLDFATAAARLGCRDAASFANVDVPMEYKTDAEVRDEWLDRQADARLEANHAD